MTDDICQFLIQITLSPLHCRKFNNMHSLQSLVLSLFALPAIASLLLLILPKTLGRIVTILSVVTLSAISVYLFISFDKPFYINLPAYTDKAVMIADILLLIYFAFIAIRRKSVLVGLLTIGQAIALGYLINLLGKHEGNLLPQLYIDRLSLFMFLLINIVSGIIATYSLQYIDEEDCSPYRKRFFMFTMLWFIGVMNLVVSADNLEYFFLFFELTTLASYIFISFRKDTESVNNALRALWMNQIGGLAILGAMIYSLSTTYETISFQTLVKLAPTVGLLLPLALLAVAALIKGAQMPFSSWLLGAMVAPTPVSALLHSSTMVKIAPFIILRLAPAIKGTSLSLVIIGLTGFVFLAAAISALAQDNFKRILAFSTISLLGLMILMAAIGTETAVVTSLILILFHGISKCMLFLNAGVLEKKFHLKSALDMDRLAESGPFTAFIVCIGFISLMLPPFGAFVGKWFSIEILGSTLKETRGVNALVMVAIACGGAVLSLLYFKVMGLLISRSGENDKIKFETTHPLYNINLLLLLGLILAGVVTLPFLLSGYFGPVANDILGSTSVVATQSSYSFTIGTMTLPYIPMVLAFLILPVSLFASLFVRFRKADRVKEYACGEKIDYKFNSYYFDTEFLMPYFIGIGVIFFALIIILTFIK